MKKLLLLLAIFISFTAKSQTCPGTGYSHSKGIKVCYDTTLKESWLNTVHADTCDLTKLTITGLGGNGLLKNVSGVVQKAAPGSDYSTPSSLHDSLVNYVLKRTGDVLFSFGTNSIGITPDNGAGAGGTMVIDNGQFLAGWNTAGFGNYIDVDNVGVTLSTRDTGSDITLLSGGAVSLYTSGGKGVVINGGDDNAIISVDLITGGDKTVYIPNATGTMLLADNPATISNKAGNISQWTNDVGYAYGLAPTAVKTSNYSAVIGDLVPCDNTSGSFTVTLPSAPADKKRIAVKMVIQGGTNTISIVTSGSDKFNKSGGGTSLTLTLLNQAVNLQYNTSGGIWYVMADDLTLASLDLRYQPLTTNGSHWASIDTSAKANVNAQNITKTGTGSTYVMNTSPVLITPTLGTASLTTVNKVAITAPASSATLTLADGSTLQLSGAFVTNFIASAAVAATLPAGTYTLAKSTDVQIFTSSGTWTKPAGAKSVWVLCIGPGGGGGSGRKSTTGVLATGGAGGGSGGSSTMTFQASDITTSTVAVTVTAGGTGGASQTTNSTDGNAGQASSGYSNSTFGIYVQGGRGSSGGGGTSSGAVSGGLPGGGMFTGQTGGSSGGTGGAGGNGNNAIGWGSASGGAGGGITTGNVSAAGGNGGVFNQIPGSSAAAGGSADTGTAGTAGTAYTYIGTGAGAGGGSTVGNAGAGGNGANYGAGGGGGGAARDGVGNSGAGGNGAGGLVVVITYF